MVLLSLQYVTLIKICKTEDFVLHEDAAGFTAHFDKIFPSCVQHVLYCVP